MGCLVLEFHENKVVAITAAGTLFSVSVSAIENGIITDLQLIRHSVHELLFNIEKQMEAKFKKVLLSLPSDQAQIIQFSTQLKFKKTFSDSYFNNMIQKLEEICLKNSLYIIKCFPSEIKIDNEKVSNPIGIYGKKCDVLWSILCLNTSIIHNFNNIFSGLHIKISDYVFYEYETINQLLDDDQKELGSIVLNIKESNSLVYIFKNSIPIQIFNFKHGYKAIDDQIAIKMNVSKKEAKLLREKYLSCLIDPNSEHHISINSRNGTVDMTLNQFIQKILPTVKSTLFSLVKQMENNNIFGYYGQIFLYGELSALLGIDILLSKFVNSKVAILKQQSGSYTANYFNKANNIKQKNSIFFKISRFTLLGLRKIYDMIKK
ncbi:MAG: hypothetical protein H6845_02500 [Alphaproteobacteria bacterium]|nr:MAG: hypothetical protein H6845_02500 [Alphaproteobacteria bacterium]